MLIKLFLLSLLIVAVASMALSFAMLWNNNSDIANEIEPRQTNGSACGACGIKDLGTCSHES